MVIDGGDIGLKKCGLVMRSVLKGVDLLLIIILAVVYCVVLLPAGIFLRVLGKDYMLRDFDKNASTYWVES